MPKLSVLMPCRNLNESSKKSIDSILKQDIDLELIITIDGGEHKYNIGDDRVIIKQNLHNSGPHFSVNNCYQFATGEYITVHDDDDWSEQDRYKVLLDEIGNSRVIASNISVIENDKVYTKFYNTTNLIESGIIKPPSHHCATILRRDIWDEIGPYNDKYRVADSMRMIKLGIYLMLNKEQFLLNERPLYNHLIRKESFSKTTSRWKQEAGITRRKIFNNYSDIVNKTPAQFMKWCRHQDF